MAKEAGTGNRVNLDDEDLSHVVIGTVSGLRHADCQDSEGLCAEFEFLQIEGSKKIIIECVECLMTFRFHSKKGRWIKYKMRFE